MYSLYFHIPFCVHRCAYCDFNTYAGKSDTIPAYVEALTSEVQSVAQAAGKRLPVHTVFFGGGTPSLLSPGQFACVLNTVRESFELEPTAEVCLEANPGTVTERSIRDLHSLGFNRLSLGMQSAHPQDLHLLERIHDYFDVIEAVRGACQAGFDNINLDLIYGLPEQPLERWRSTLELALGLQPEHLSLYALSVEPGTPFGRWANSGRLPLPDPDLAADMYEYAEQRLAAAGYSHYEISNWARRGFQCRHNLQYWRGLPYLGFGAGAHGYAAGTRYSNVLRIGTYIQHMRAGAPASFPCSAAVVETQKISPHVEMQETMMTGLRLTEEGVSKKNFHQRFSQEILDVFGKEIVELVGLGLLEWTDHDQSIRLTPRGRQVGNQVFLRFVD